MALSGSCLYTLFVCNFTTILVCNVTVHMYIGMFLTCVLFRDCICFCICICICICICFCGCVCVCVCVSVPDSNFHTILHKQNINALCVYIVFRIRIHNDGLLAYRNTAGVLCRKHHHSSKSASSMLGPKHKYINIKILIDRLDWYAHLRLRTGTH